MPLISASEPWIRKTGNQLLISAGQGHTHVAPPANEGLSGCGQNLVSPADSPMGPVQADPKQTLGRHLFPKPLGKGKGIAQVSPGGDTPGGEAGDGILLRG
jgi:hypothetical protein